MSYIYYNCNFLVILISLWISRSISPFKRSSPIVDNKYVFHAEESNIFFENNIINVIYDTNCLLVVLGYSGGVHNLSYIHMSIRFILNKFENHMEFI